MIPSASKPWIGAALLVGVLYLVVGIVFGELASRPPSPRFWRLAAWVVSAMAFAAHIGYERFRLRHAPVAAALHASLAVAFGAFGLAAAATIRSAVTGTGNLRLLALALVAWPVLAAVPAFLVALAAGALVARAPGQTS